MSQNGPGRPDSGTDSSDKNTPAECRECGTDLGAGYLCDECDTVEGWE